MGAIIAAMRYLQMFAIGLAGTVLFSCGGDDLVLPSAGEPATITIVPGNALSGRVGEVLADPLVVEVLDGVGAARRRGDGGDRVVQRRGAA